MQVSDEGVRLPSTGKPNHIMIGFDRPGGGVRLYASRELPTDVGWGQRDVKRLYGVTAWHVDADMLQVLVIDKPTWGEAYARAFEVWANQDRAKAEEVREIASRAALAEGQRSAPAAGADEIAMGRERRRGGTGD